MRRLLRVLSLAAVSLIVLVAALWAALTIHYGPDGPTPLRSSVAVVFVAGFALAFVLLRQRRRVLVVFSGAWLVVALWSASFEPSNDRDWCDEHRRIASVEQRGDRCTIHGVRSSIHHADGTSTHRWVDREIDLAAARDVDLVLVYWDGNRSIAHMMLSFGFDAGPRLVLSVETRREADETYSAVAGFFKQFELCYVLADESDALYLRSHVRGEDVHVFPAIASREQVRWLLELVLRRVQRLSEQPVFYDALFENCTTSLLALEAEAGEAPVFDWRYVANGWLDQLLYERGTLVADVTQGLSYERMHAAHLVDPAAIPSREGYGEAMRASLPPRR